MSNDIEKLDNMISKTRILQGIYSKKIMEKAKEKGVKFEVVEPMQILCHLYSIESGLIQHKKRIVEKSHESITEWEDIIEEVKELSEVMLELLIEKTKKELCEEADEAIRRLHQLLVASPKIRMNQKANMCY